MIFLIEFVVSTFNLKTFFLQTRLVNPQYLYAGKLQQNKKNHSYSWPKIYWKTSFIG